MTRSRDKKQRRMRRMQKEKKTPRRGSGKKQSVSNTRLLASVSIVLAVLAAVIGGCGYNLVCERVKAHGLCPECIFEGPIQMLLLALILGGAAVFVGLEWRRARRENAMHRKVQR